MESHAVWPFVSGFSPVKQLMDEVFPVPQTESFVAWPASRALTAFAPQLLGARC